MAETSPPPESSRPRHSSALYSMGGVFVVIVAVRVALQQERALILSDVRAYVGGEGLYSKAQKRAVIELLLYARSGSQAHWQAYEQALTVPLGDRDARLELLRKDPDIGRAAEAFVRGQNHPADAERMARFFLRFQEVSYVAEAIRIWTDGDREIAELQALGAALRQLIEHDSAPPVALDGLLSQIMATDARLTILEDRFASTLSEGARFILSVTENMLLALAVLLLGVGWMYSLRVTREMRRAEAALRGSEARYRVLSESMLEGLLILRDGRFLHANPAAQRLVGATLEELVGTEFIPLIHPDFRSFVAERHRRRMAGEVLPPRYDIRVVSRAGKETWVQLANELVDWDGKPAVLTIISDISERKRTEDQVTALNETLERRVSERTAELKRSNQELEAFNYSVSHDLRAPLGVISCFAAVLRSDFIEALPDKAKQYLTHIEYNAAQMAQLIDNLLEFSRMGRTVLARSPVNMRSLVDDVVLELRQADTPAQPVIGELPPALGDAGLLRQGWHHLIRHAVQISGKTAPPSVQISY